MIIFPRLKSFRFQVQYDCDRNQHLETFKIFRHAKLSGLLQINATLSGTSKKMVYKVEKGTQYEEQKKDVGRKRQSTDELLSKRDHDDFNTDKVCNSANPT